jgi:hypothetical protein
MQENMANAYKIVFGKSEGQELLGRTRHKLEGNI